MSNLMAEFRQTVVEVPLLSESNAVTYKMNLEAGRQSVASSIPLIKVNGTALSGQVMAQGLNVHILSGPTTISETKTFNFTTTDSTVNTAFTTYMNALTGDKVAIITSAGKLNTSPSVDAWFSNAKSTNWLNQAVINRFSVVYCALYSVAKKKIIQECVHIDTNSNSSESANLELVYDTLADIGATGYSWKPIFDSTEYKATTGYEFKRYPADSLITANISDYGITAGSTVLLTGELFADQSLLNSNMTCQLSFRLYNGSTLLSTQTSSILAKDVNKWTKFEIFANLPSNASAFIITVSRYPNTANAIGTAGVRNVSLAEVSRPNTSTPFAGFGVNGVRANSIVDGSIDPLLLNLNNTKISSENKISFVGIREEQQDLTQFINSAFEGTRYGFAYDINDLSTLYQDQFARTPAEVDKPVGLVLDKSKRLMVGLNLLKNSLNSSDEWLTNADWAIGNGYAVSGANITGSFYRPSTLEAGKWYEAFLTVDEISSGFVNLPYDGTGANQSNVTTPGTYRRVFYAGTSSLYVYASNFTGKVSNIVVRELAGNHAYQSTSDQRPILRQNTFTGSYYLDFNGTSSNLLVHKLDFTSTDKFTILGAFNNLATGAARLIFELSTESWTQNKTFALFGPFTNAGYSVRVRGTTTVDVIDEEAPLSAVVVAISDLASNASSLKVNSKTITSSAAIGGGSFGLFDGYIGSRGGAANFFKGHLYSLICVDSLVDDTNITSELTKRI